MNIDKLKENLQTVQANLSKDVTLIAVTKQVDAQVNRQLLDLGVHHFGENRPQALLDKLESLKDLREEIKWHFIGNLQSRQVKNIINEIDYLHSLDRLSLAKEIQKRADHPIPCFLQVNVSGEASKSGFQANEVMEALEKMAAYDKIKIIGLMTMAPLEASPQDIHSYFGQLKALQEEVKALKLAYAPCQELSMGMSHDYLIAIEEGATYIRLGSALYQ